MDAIETISPKRASVEVSWFKSRRHEDANENFQGLSNPGNRNLHLMASESPEGLKPTDHRMRVENIRRIIGPNL